MISEMLDSALAAYWTSYVVELAMVSEALEKLYVYTLMSLRCYKCGNRSLTLP